MRAVIKAHPKAVSICIHTLRCKHVLVLMDETELLIPMLFVFFKIVTCKLITKDKTKKQFHILRLYIMDIVSMKE